MKTLIVIGAGITGLTAAYYAHQHGFKVDVYEQHDKAGGLCTSWKRKGFTIDGCIHWLVGSKPGSAFYKIWTEIGALENKKLIHPDFFARVEDTEGHHLTLYADADQLEKHLLELFPEDSTMIKKTIRKIRKQTGMEYSLENPPQLLSPGSKIKMMVKMLPVFWNLIRCMSVSMEKYVQKFKNPFLRKALIQAFGKKSAFQSLAGIMAWYNDGNAGFPVGGSIAMSRSIEQKLIDTGVKIHYKSPVSKILVEDDKAVGILLADGTKVKSDLVLSAADGYSTIYSLLEGKYTNKAIETLYRKHSSPTIIQVSFGISDTMEKMPSSVIEIFKQPVVLAGKELESIMFKNYNYDPGLAPRGKSIVTCTIQTNYDYWEKIEYHSDAYKKEKEKITEFAIQWLEKKYPGIQQKIEMTDVVTPLTYYRYTSSWRGSIMSWISGAWEKLPTHPKKLPGLSGFYMAGQWTMPPGGLPVAALSAKWTVQIMENEVRNSYPGSKKN